MEILNYDKETEKIVLVEYSQKVSEMVTKVKEMKWDFEENIINFFSPDLLKICDQIFEKKTLNDYSSSKKIKKMKDNKDKENTKKLEFAEKVKILYTKMPKPKENKTKCNIKINELKRSLQIDYPCLNSIVELIMCFLENIINQSNYPQLLYEICYQNNFRSIMDRKIWGGDSILDLKSNLNKVEIITFCLSSSAHDTDITLEPLFLFYYFYKLFFPNVKHFTINLNEVKINNIYNVDKNPYKIRVSDVCLYGSKFNNLFISNFILVDIISNYESLNSLRIISAESYFNEINSLFLQQFGDNYKKNIQTIKALIYFRKLMMVKSISRLSISINSLDRFLFEEVINLIALHRDMKILELELFHEPKGYNIRKICLNYLMGQEFFEVDPNNSEKYQIIMYPYLDSLNGIPQLVDEDKIPDIIFKEFRSNLFKLKLILSNFIKSFECVYLDVTPYEGLTKYDGYNVEIILFIFVVLLSLEKSDYLKALDLRCLNINFATIVQMKKYINNTLNSNNNETKIDRLVDLSSCNKLESLTMNMAGISYYVDFNKLPYINLKKLCLEIFSIEDLVALGNGLKEKKDVLKKLKEIKVDIPLNENEQILNEVLSVLVNIPQGVEYLKLSIENEISIDMFNKMLKFLNKGINESGNKKLKIVLNYQCDNYNELLYENKELDNLVTKICEIQNPCKGYEFGLINWPDKNIIFNVLFSAKTKFDINGLMTSDNKLNDRKKIFSKIFAFLGKSYNFVINSE